MRFSKKWEKIDNMTWRLQVIGGWIVECFREFEGQSTSNSIIFISDPKYEWELEEGQQ